MDQNEHYPLKTSNLVDKSTMTSEDCKTCKGKFLGLWKKSYGQELLVIPGYKGLMSLDILDGIENSMFRHSLISSLNKKLVPTLV